MQSKNDDKYDIEDIVDKLQKIGEKVEIEYELYTWNRKMLKL